MFALKELPPSERLLERLRRCGTRPLECFKCHTPIPIRVGEFNGEPINFFPITCPDCGAGFGLALIQRIAEAKSEPQPSLGAQGTVPRKETAT